MVNVLFLYLRHLEKSNRAYIDFASKDDALKAFYETSPEKLDPDNNLLVVIFSRGYEGNRQFQRREDREQNFKRFHEDSRYSGGESSHKRSRDDDRIRNHFERNRS